MSKMADISLLLCFIALAGSSVCNVFAHSHPKVEFYELKNGNISVNLTNWGASIVSLLVPDRRGKQADIVLGYDSIKEYQTDKTYFGAIAGRVANRIGGARFELNNKTYKLPANDGKNTLHGGIVGFSDVAWIVKQYKNNRRSQFIEFTYNSKDGEEGFPGDLLVCVKYTLYRSSLGVSMRAEALNKPTPVNLAQHTYWNLGGHDSGDILNNEIRIFSSHITVVDKELIPTGKLARVKGTPYDFLKPLVIKNQMKKLGYGYDINYALDGPAEPHKHMKRAAVVFHRKSGRSMVVWTNAPGVQFYTGNYIDNVKGKGGFRYQAHAGLCLETQGYPDAVNHPNFPSTIVTRGTPYRHRMVYRFSY